MAKTKKNNRSKSALQPVQVDIVSDIVCPWCWLGLKYFQRAMVQSHRKIMLTWRPYMLDPTIPETGVSYRDYMSVKFGDGPSNRFKAMREHLEAAAPRAGITFKFDDIPMRPNTLNAHRLLRWAQGQDKGDVAAEALFEAFFVQLKDIGDINVLADVGEDIGMDRDILADLLASDEDKKAVEEEIAFFQRLGVSGVPCFIYQGQFVVQGAQPPEVHLAAIEKAAQAAPTADE